MRERGVGDPPLSRVGVPDPLCATSSIFILEEEWSSRLDAIPDKLVVLILSNNPQCKLSSPTTSGLRLQTSPLASGSRFTGVTVVANMFKHNSILLVKYLRPAPP